MGHLHRWVAVLKLHPVLVNFTAALVPVSALSDLVARWRHDAELRATAWWTLLAAACVTPLTAVTGWLFWMEDDEGVTGMMIHRWLGASLVFVLVALCAWRRRIRRREGWASGAYLIVACIVVALLIVQGTLGGHQAFREM